MNLLDRIVHDAINPAMKLLPTKLDSPPARVQLLATGLQESRFEWRYQRTSTPYVKGPAKGFWQNERTGAVRAVMANRATEALARDVCKARNVRFDETAVHSRLEFDDILAAAFARLILWAEPRSLPPVQADHETAWQYYLHAWRPGKPHRETWDEFHEQARTQVLKEQS